MPHFSVGRRRLIAAGVGAPLLIGAGGSATPQVSGQALPGDAALPEPPATRVGWAIVGLGSFALGQVIPGFLDARLSRIGALVSGNPDKRKQVAERYGVPRSYSYEDYDRLIDDDGVECVYIALPVGLHAEYTIRALKAGKHVLCEKPMASTSQECEAMITAAREAGRQLGVAYRVHFEATNLEALRRFRAGEIGELRHLSTEAGFVINPEYPPHAWRLTRALGGGGSMFDIGIYGLNGALMYFDEPPREVSAVYSTPQGDPRFAEVEGGIDWRLRFANGVSVQGASSYTFSYTTGQRMLGSRGSLELQPASTYYDNALSLRRDGQPPALLRPGNPIQQFAAQVDAFSEAARSGTPHRTPGEMGLRDIRLIEAMYRSADQQGALVRVG